MQNGSEGEPYCLSLIPRNHKVEGENYPHVILFFSFWFFETGFLHGF